MTADKKFLSQATPVQGHHHHKLQFADKAESELAALDSLDLAHSLDLLDVDGEDPYGALQDYLERVKVSVFVSQPVLLWKMQSFLRSQVAQFSD